MKDRMLGFTLIELMITVAVVGILAAVAYPSYTSQIMRSNRAEARTALLQVQVNQEKFFLQRSRYAGDTTAALSVTELNNLPTDATTPGLGVASTTPKNSYKIELVRSTTAKYTATATAQGSQTKDTGCATMSIDEVGNKTPVAGNCWN